MGNRLQGREGRLATSGGRATHRVRAARAGFSLVEVLIAAVVLAVAVTGISGSILSSMTLNRVNRDSATAQQAARRVMEEIHGVPFDEVFACYNADTSDDHLSRKVSARGPSFAVAGLDAQTGDADGLCGRVVLPAIHVGGADQLREDFVDEALGMPRDLNGDSRTDQIDHAQDPELLLIPVRVTVAWRGVSGPRQIDLETMLVAN